ncbi:MAG: hypothetical protein ABEK36_03690 [Candidatus Aenigmatarchaeota archaeon]
MGSYTKIIFSIILILLGIWLLLPNVPIIKPSNPIIEGLMWWPSLLVLIKGIIPIGTFLFGSLLLWIEYDEWKSAHSTDKTDRKNIEDVGKDEMPAFEDVEYKDLKCPECGEDFKTDIGLRVHRKVNHPDEFKKNPDPYGEGD